MEVINFDAIEEQKENIEPVKEGRSASSLKGIFSIPHNQLKKQQLEERLKIEKELESIDELDDPIQPFLDYIHWIRTNYPSGASVESGLVQVLERCTSQFRDFDFYKNDARYLNVWLTYAKYSENPRDIFIYLARKEIGTNLALYYEEYANYLELNKRIFQAGKVYEEGVRFKARPLARLERRYNEFKMRTDSVSLQDNEPHSPVFPVRSALSLKSGGSLFSVQDGPRLQKRKLEIFNDGDNDHGNNGEVDAPRTKGWDTLGTAAFRNKENKLEATPWVGETLEQTNRKRQHLNKISVFQDGGGDDSAGKVFKFIENPGRKTEKVDLNFDLLYRESEECSIQEVLFQLRTYSKKIGSSKKSLKESNGNYDDQAVSLLDTKPKTLDKSNDATIHLNNKMDTVIRPSSPTMTMFTREAKDEVYSMFNQKPVETDTSVMENDHQLVYDDFTEQLTRPNLNDLTEKVPHMKIEENMTQSNKEDYYGVNHNEDIGMFDPVNEEFKEKWLLEMNPHVSSYKGFHYHEKDMKMCNTLKKLSSNNKQFKNLFLDFTKSNYNMVSLLGHGGFASVYLAESMDGEFKAIKGQQPASAWEFYIIKQLEQRLAGHKVLNSIIVIDEVHLFKDESYLIMEYEKQGTILDVVNLYKATGRNVDEALVIFLTVEILKLIEEMHEVGILHGDLKPDNCMLRLDPGSTGEYDKNGSNGWSKKGIKLIDFGRSIDMTMFPPNSRFKTNIKTDNQDCPEMRNDESWSFEVDYFGIAGILHTMLFGTFIETIQKDGKYKLASPFKRYWNHELWSPLFDLLINSRSHGDFPITQKLRDQRLVLERWLEAHGSILSGIIRDIETGLN
ncbi:putative serine/threonine-protein kinase [Wickerhamomyces ciferrii]|uniref:Serine/threonine-protein kinase n=1 Tax=Wickerhamomyces ciferrii (strain ATCC 14091 / BCRC 22168 / CBS 111 / JCM 3599 / NBRC 0793 / NRRL Y-1031 F-60-10) TaxID=1206466 RepID=K0KSW5_WICCF|nr:putative serine/threonine-protein kinase [Wickerhamomyces ciferrii]CCH45142.1 putative serine/threonine-protein kinase [Wickerhamomyces ciferrii]